ncbi:substrate-binding domain-containing protein [uncultured Victivallis sp.]|uniref:substrate-binding domain-containing protein n=1 Tax=uncultured Victivallis sp. TaxID=354118 RepID=UPI0025E4861A|nr:substrate-binding domain-containing protein [uncultured Victivallis sp.]
MSRDISSQVNFLYEKLLLELNHFAVSRRFFSIRELMSRYQVSRRIVEKVLARLEEEQRIRIEPARGSFVRESKCNKRIIVSVHCDWPSERLEDLDAAIAEEVNAYSGWIFSRALFCPDFGSHFIKLLKEIHGNVFLLRLPVIKLTQQLIVQILSLPTPVIFWGNDILIDGINVLDSNSEFAGMLAAECLVRNGHRKIALILSEPHNIFSWRRNNTFLSYLRLHGLAPVVIDCEIRSGEASMAKTHDRMVAYFKTHGADFSACFVSSDYSALGVMSACRECGLEVPDDISIIGSGNISCVSHSQPQLTTIADDLPGIARTFCEGVEELFNGGHFGIRTVSPYLIERQSVRVLSGEEENTRQRRSTFRSL